MKSRWQILTAGVLAALFGLFVVLDMPTQDNPLQPPGSGDGGESGGNPLQPPSQEKPKEVLRRGTKEEIDAIDAKWKNKEKGEENKKLKLEAIAEALAIDDARTVKLLVLAADSDRQKDKDILKAGQEALANKIAHIEGLYRNEAEEDRIAAVEMALHIDDERMLRLFRRARKDMSAKIKEISKKGALTYLQDLFRSKNYKMKLDALIEAAEMIEEPGMEKLLQAGLKDSHPKVREIAIRYIGSFTYAKKPGFLPAIENALKVAMKNPKEIELQKSYLRCIGDYGDPAGVKILNKMVQNLARCDKADPIQVQRNIAGLDGLGRLRVIESCETIMNLWTNLNDACSRQDTAPQTEEGKAVSQKYYGACAGAMAELCTNVPGCATTEGVSQGEYLNDIYKNWKKWFDDNKKKLEEAWKNKTR
jgi:hypothetical protein